MREKLEMSFESVYADSDFRLWCLRNFLRAVRPNMVRWPHSPPVEDMRMDALLVHIKVVSGAERPIPPPIREWSFPKLQKLCGWLIKFSQSILPLYVFIKPLVPANMGLQKAEAADVANDCSVFGYHT